MSYRSRSYSRSRSRSPRGTEREFRPRTNAPDSAPKIFVGNLAYDTQESDFKAHFEHCGKIVEVLMPRDPHNNRSKGYGFVTFEDFDSMEKAINKMDRSKLLGNEIKVDRANERKERPKFQDDRRSGGYSSRGGSTYDNSRGGYDRDRGGSSYNRDRGYDNRGGYDSRGGSYRSGGYDGDRGGGGGGGKKPVGYRCRISGLARDAGWQLLKDFLRQAGDVTYANVDPDGLGVGEYQSYSECRDAIDKLTGAALDGHIVKLTALNFDYDTGERLDRPSSRNFDMSSSRSNPYDFSSKNYRSSGGNNSNFVQRRDGGGSYNNGRSGSAGYSDDRDDRDGDYRSSHDRYRDDNRGASGVVYSNAHNAPGGSSRYGGGGGGGGGADHGGSSKYGGGSSAAGGSSRYGGGGPDRSRPRSRSVDRQGPYDRPSGSH